MHAKLIAELPAWRNVRGPKFSLNDLCTEKLVQYMEPTQWIFPETSSSVSGNVTITDVVYVAPPKLKKKVTKKHG